MVYTFTSKPLLAKAIGDELLKALEQNSQENKLRKDASKQRYLNRSLKPQLAEQLSLNF